MHDLKTLTILFRTLKSIEAQVRDDIKRYGLNTTEFGVLEVLYHKGPLTIQEVKEKILIAASSMSYVIDTLVRKGFVQRVKHDKDKRSFILELTEAGTHKMAEIYPLHVATMRQRLDVLDKDEKTLQELLKKIGKYQKERSQI